MGVRRATKDQALTLRDVKELIRDKKQESEMLTLQEVADKLKVSSRTVTRLMGRGELVGRQVGRQWRFTPEAVNAYMTGS